MRKDWDVIAVIIGLLLVVASWWYFWTSPRNEALMDIAECMSGDVTLSSYERCVQSWKEQNIMHPQGGSP